MNFQHGMFSDFIELKLLQEANDSETLTMIMDCNYTVPDHISKQCQVIVHSNYTVPDHISTQCQVIINCNFIVIMYLI